MNADHLSGRMQIIIAIGTDLLNVLVDIFNHLSLLFSGRGNLHIYIINMLDSGSNGGKQTFQVLCCTHYFFGLFAAVTHFHQRLVGVVFKFINFALDFIGRLRRA